MNWLRIACLLNVQVINNYGNEIMEKLILKRVFKYIKLRQQFAILSVAIINTLLGASLPIMYGIVIQQVVIDNDLNLLFKCIVILTVISLALGITSILKSYMVSKVGEHIGMQIRNEIYEKIWYLDDASKHEFGLANIISLVNTDIFQVTMFISRFMYDSILQILTLIIIIVIMFYMNIALALCAMLVIPMFTFLFIHMGKKTQIISRKRQQVFVEINEQLQEDIKGCSFLQINGAIKHRKKMFEQLVQGFFKINLKQSVFTNVINQIASIIASIGDIIVIGFGGYLCIKGEISIAVIIAFQSYTGHLFSPISSLVSLNQISKIALPSLERIFKFIDIESKIVDEDDAITLKDKINSISFENVTLNYGDKIGVLKDISFNLNAGTMTAIIGKSGCGKSSLCNLLARIIELDSGCIYINDNNYKKYSLNSLRKKVYMVPQEPYIFKGTIKDNIKLGEEIDDEKVSEAINKAGLLYINDKPIDLNMVIGEEGYTLSGGEKRRLALARAFVRNFEVLILDEPTSGLDNITREKLMLNLKEECSKGKIIIIVSHYSSDFKMANNIVTIKDGSVYGIGNYKELFNNNEYFRELVGDKIGYEE